MQLGGERMDRASQFRVGLEFQLLFVEVVICFGLLEDRLPVLPIMTNVDRKIASSDTISVSIGHGSGSMTSIQMPNSTA